MPDTPLLAVERLDVTMRGAPVLEDVSFQIAPGETLGLVGESGCGKSTLGRVVCGIHPATEGRRLWQGEDVDRLQGSARDHGAGGQLRGCVGRGDGRQLDIGSHTTAVVWGDVVLLRLHGPRDTRLPRTPGLLGCRPRSYVRPPVGSVRPCQL